MSCSLRGTLRMKPLGSTIDMTGRGASARARAFASSSALHSERHPTVLPGLEAPPYNFWARWESDLARTRDGTAETESRESLDDGSLGWSSERSPGLSPPGAQVRCIAVLSTNSIATGALDSQARPPTPL
jgi:hypothetical protein